MLPASLRLFQASSRRYLQRCLSSSSSTAAVKKHAPAGSSLRLWHFAVGISAPAGYYFWRSRERDAAIAETAYLISPRRVEAEDLEERAKLAFEPVLELQTRLRKTQKVIATPKDVSHGR